ncbi:MAG: hypothetical protein RBS36_04305 [Thiomicrospira sp.]|nr:hypothetical protein [Thiomicrospira sp.]
MEKPSQKEMREEVLHLLKTNPDASYTIIEIMDKLTYEPGWRSTLAKIVSTLKGEGIVVGEKHEGDLVMSYSIHELELHSLADEPEQLEDPQQPEAETKSEQPQLGEVTHEYYLLMDDKSDSAPILLHEGVGTLKGAINMAETLAKQEMCDIVIQRIETITVGTVKTTVQTQFQPA